jgi:hypothetical protein
MEESVEKFFPDDYKNWDLSTIPKEQAENIQIIADGQRMNTAKIDLFQWIDEPLIPPPQNTKIIAQGVLF